MRQGAQPPHGSVHSSTHRLSHAESQQKKSIAQTHASHAQPLQPGVSWSSHPDWHAPQSSGHDSQASPSPQTPSPHAFVVPHIPHCWQASAQQSPNWTQASSQKHPPGAAPPQTPAHDRLGGHAPQSF